jgi:CRP-like cAMP-binding protein
MNTSLRANIADQPFFRGMKAEHLDIIAANAEEKSFEPKQILFHEGEPANRFFIIQSGKIVLEAHEAGREASVVQTLGPGEVLGWSWLFPPFAWHLRARVIEPTTALVLDGAHLLIAAEMDHDFGYRLMKRIAQLLIARLQATTHQVLTHSAQSALAA